MIRQIIKIDKDKCNGCGLCVSACHEGAISLIEGKAQLIRDDYCDGLGDCLPSCPTGAISFEKREALAYNEQEVKRNMAKKQHGENHNASSGCPGTKAKAIKHDNIDDKKDSSAALPCGCPGHHAKAISRNQADFTPATSNQATNMASRLNQWPVQIKLVPVNAAYFENAHLLVSADCAAYAYANFHNDFIKNRITLVGCPKLDNTDYSEKLAQILTTNNIKSVTAVRMEVPCCGGIEQAVKNAIISSGKAIPWSVVTISCNGEVLDDTL